jgi:hypothetical protein
MRWEDILHIRVRNCLNHIDLMKNKRPIGLKKVAYDEEKKFPTSRMTVRSGLPAYFQTVYALGVGVRIIKISH